MSEVVVEIEKEGVSKYFRPQFEETYAYLQWMIASKANIIILKNIHYSYLKMFNFSKKFMMCKIQINYSIFIFNFLKLELNFDL